jgi:hypothetical protein
MTHKRKLAEVYVDSSAAADAADNELSERSFAAFCD